jgi:hypothetical protein
MSAADNNCSVFGIYPDFRSLRASVDTLKAYGIENDEISVLFREWAVARTFVPGSNFRTSHETASRIGSHTEPLIGGTLEDLTYVHSVGSGAISGALVSLGISNSEAERYEGRIEAGKLLVCVRSSAVATAEETRDILTRTGAEDVACADHLKTSELRIEI